MIEDRVMPGADPQVKVGFGSSLVAVAMFAAYGVYGIAVSDGRGIAVGLVGAVAFALFAALLRAQQR